MRLIVVTMLSCISICSWAQSSSPDGWTSEERESITKMRNTYAEQGLEFTDEQASDLVVKLRQKRQSVGVPESEWTEDERAIIGAMRAQASSQGRDLPVEKAQLTVMKLRAASPMGASPAQRSAAALATVPAAAPAQSRALDADVSEEAMAEKIATTRGIAEPLRFTGERDGFSVNGRRFVDPEGPVVMHAHNVITKNIGYIVRRRDDFAIKMLPKAEVSSDPLLVATAIWARGRWTVNTVTGKNVSGRGLSVAPSGVIVSRESAAFIYQAGQGLQSVPIPEGYEVAPMQRGDVAGTGYLLVTRTDARGGQSAMSKAASSLKSLGALVGMGKKEDYALMELQTGRLIPMNIDAIGNDVSELSGCVPVNGLVNKCSSVQSFESLYTDTGRNISHYFWRAAWFPTPSGPIAVSLENGVKDIFVTDLKTGQRVTAFHRVLGINGYDADQNAEGLIAINARWSFSDHRIADAAALLRADVAGETE